MAATSWKRLIKLAIVAAINLALIFLVAPVWGTHGAAEAGIIDDLEERLLIGWEQGKEGLKDLLSLIEHAPDLHDILVRATNLLEKLKEDRWPAPCVQSIALPEGLDYEFAVNTLLSLPGVGYVERDARVSMGASSSDPYYPKQWFLPHIGAEMAWDVEKGNKDILVAVMDTGVDPDHPDLSGRVMPGYDFINDDSNPCDVHGHGTHVAGIIAACGDNGGGAAGVAWRVRVLPIKVLDDQGYGHYSDVIAGLHYAVDNGAEVINLSLGGGAPSVALQDAVNHARSMGAVVVAAAGNEALDSLNYPAACEGVIGVGATDEQDRPTAFSNQGEGLDLMAPGISILSGIPGGEYTYMSGTSMAAPQVSGAFALLRSHYPDINVAETEQKLLASAYDLGSAGYDLISGWGLLQAHKALGIEDDDPSQGFDPGGDVYFAEGYTGNGFDTYILLENPDSEASSARLELFGRQGPFDAVDLGLAARSRLTINLNQVVPGEEVSARVILPEGSRVQAQRSVYFDYGGIRGGHTSRGCPSSTDWYFAEGYTGAGYDTYLLIFNPNEEPAKVKATWLTPNSVEEEVFELPSLSRRTIKLDDILPDVEVATLLSADIAVVAERAMYFDAEGRLGGSVAAGVVAAAEEWYFAEGYTGGDFDEWILLANTTDQHVAATVTLQRCDGIRIERDMVLRPLSRSTLHVDEVIGLENTEVSATVKAAFPGVVAERAMYFTYRGGMGEVGGGHAAPGAIYASSHWLVPEGYTGEGFESWILVSNLEDKQVAVMIDIYGESGSHIRKEVKIPAHSRFTIKENDLLAGEGVSAELSAADGIRLVVEGAFYFRYQGDIDGGST